MEPTTSWFQVGFISTAPRWELQDISIYFKMMLITICHHTKILHSLIIFRTLYISYLWLIYFVTESLYLFISLFLLFPHALRSRKHLFLLWLYFCSVLLVHFFKIPHIKWNRTVFLFLWLNFSKYSISGYIHIVTNGTFSFFSMANILECVCVHILLLYPFICWWKPHKESL